ncbi:MAG: YeeE/YedE family protein [Solirubrobacteraceae bacterium]
MLHAQLPWFLAGPLLGGCVVAVRALLNGRLGVTGGYSEVVTKVSRGSLRLDWRGWFLIGLLAGGALFAVLAGGPDFHGYGWLSDTFSSGAVIGAILVLSGVAIGFGAKIGGGCTSGNGLSGNSMLSPAALVATATFFATAIVVSFVIEALI